MAVFTVSYDTNSFSIVEEVRRLDSVKLCEGTYAVSFNGTAKDLWQYLASAAGKNALLFVLKATPDCYGQVGESARHWFEKTMRAKRF